MSRSLRRPANHVPGAPAGLDTTRSSGTSFNLMVEYHGHLSDVYAALGSDLRRAIIDRLARGEARVTDVAAPFDVSLAAVSKHVLVLERAGLIRRRVDGRTHWLALEPAALAEAEAWIGRTRSFWSERLDALDALLRRDPAGPASA